MGCKQNIILTHSNEVKVCRKYISISIDFERTIQADIKWFCLQSDKVQNTSILTERYSFEIPFTFQMILTTKTKFESTKLI